MKKEKPSLNHAAAAILICLSFLTGCDWIKARFYISHMESNDRVARLDVARIINALAIRPGIAIGDIGAGSGLFIINYAPPLKISLQKAPFNPIFD